MVRTSLSSGTFSRMSGSAVSSDAHRIGSAAFLLPDGSIVKARELSGRAGVLFRRNSVTGAVQAVARDGREWGGLNTALHAN